MIYYSVLFCLTGMALLSGRAFPYALVLALQWAVTAALEKAGLWLWMPWADAVVFYALLGTYALHPAKRGIVCIGLAAVTVAAHATYYWPNPVMASYGNEYMYAMRGLFMAAMAALALGDFDARSFVGNVLAGVRGLRGDPARPGLARSSSVASQD